MDASHILNDGIDSDDAHFWQRLTSFVVAPVEERVQVDVDGRQYFLGFVRFRHDTQRQTLRQKVTQLPHCRSAKLSFNTRAHVLTS